ncbi:hypothetical protein RSW15_24200, partial [Escherichia coli]|uniref:hypothetical protein n=1 Tax=Escherichia coli TaxID=562 RepID=UPI0028DD602D
RKPANSLHILRATTVLTHATLEDYLRNLLQWRLPHQDTDKIENIPLVGTSAIGRPSKFNLGELVAHKNKRIDTVIKESIAEYLGILSFNDT